MCPPAPIPRDPEMRIAICTACRSGRVSDGYAQSIGHSTLAAERLGHEVIHLVCRSQAILPSARNFLVAKALEYDCDKILMVDDDQSWPPEDFVRLMLSEEPIIGGVSQGRNTNWNQPPRFNVQWMETPKGMIPSGTPIEVMGLGCGFLWIHRSVFDKIAELDQAQLYIPPAQAISTAEPWWRYHRNWFDYQYATFDPSDEDRATLLSLGYPAGIPRTFTGEDYYFCRSARKAGFKIMADPDCAIVHYDGCVEHNLRITQVNFQ